MSDENVTDIVDDLLEQKPQARPLEELIVETTESPEEFANSFSASGTASGNAGSGAGSEDNTVFNPEIHRVDSTGKPILNRDGRTYQRKRGRKKGGTNTGQSTGPQTVYVTPDSGEQKQRALGFTTAFMICQVCQVAFGPEWKPAETELREMGVAWGEYYVATGMAEPPPIIGVLLVTSVYAMPRLQHANTQTKVGKIWGWIKSKIFRIKPVVVEEPTNA